MIKVIGRDEDDPWLLDVGISTHKLLAERPEAYVIFSIEELGLSLAFAHDASCAAHLVLDMIQYGGHLVMDAPIAVREIIANHAHGQGYH